LRNDVGRLKRERDDQVWEKHTDGQNAEKIPAGKVDQTGGRALEVGSRLRVPSQFAEIRQCVKNA